MVALEKEVYFGKEKKYNLNFLICRDSIMLPMIFATVFLTFFTTVILIMSIVKDWPISSDVIG